MPTPGSLADFMPALETLHGQVATALVTAGLPQPRVYRWRPLQMPELPAIYPWIGDSPYEVTATSRRVQDTLNVSCRVATQHAETAQDGMALEAIIDTYRLVVDTALIDPATSPFAAIARVVDRTGMRNVIDRFNDIPLLCVEFSLQAQLQRFLPTS